LKGSLAEIDGRLRINDQILEINGKNVKYGNKEEALKLIGVTVFSKYSNKIKLIFNEYFLIG
jgi:hypothetical protein